VRTILLLVLAAVATLIMQRYVGGETIYAPEVAAQREADHQFILTNRLPPGKTWSSYGLAGTNARAATVYLAEGIHRAFKLSLHHTYFLIDTLALFASLLGLYAFLRLGSTPAFALFGLLYFCLVLPLTYALHVFHPWDRLSVLFWIALLCCLRTDRLGAFAALLVAGILVKYDLVPLPGLYFLVNWRRQNARRITLTTLALFLLSFGTYAALSLHFGSGVGQRTQVWAQITRNLDYLGTTLILYPPLLAFTLPLLLTVIGWRSADRFARAAAVFAGLLVFPLFLATNFGEVRAEIPFLLLLLPCALTGLQSIMPRVHQLPAGAPT